MKTRPKLYQGLFRVYLFRPHGFIRSLVCRDVTGFFVRQTEHVWFSTRLMQGSMRAYEDCLLSQTPGRIQKVDPLMGVPIKYP